MRSRTRIAVATFLGAVFVACGIDLLGTAPVPDGGADGGEDGPYRDGGRADGPLDEGGEIYLDAQPISDALLDVNPANCYPVCDGGNCNDAGACVFTCDGTDPSCPPAGERVVCPPGVPCEVYCTGVSTCDRGVDCSQASRCKIDCNGTNVCRGDTIDCTGDSCEVSCRSVNSCNRQVSCDAGSCVIKCTGSGSCTSAPVACNADTCTVECGGELTANACDRAVTCTAKNACNVTCTGTNTCRGAVLSAVADKVDVTCAGSGQCDKGVQINAGDGGVLCKGTSACGTGSTDGISCDGGRCQVACDGTGTTAVRSCCSAAICAPPKAANACKFTDAGCP